jgi:hypothetical protein
VGFRPSWSMNDLRVLPSSSGAAWCTASVVTQLSSSRGMLP